MRDAIVRCALQIPGSTHAHKHATESARNNKQAPVSGTSPKTYSDNGMATRYGLICGAVYYCGVKWYAACEALEWRGWRARRRRGRRRSDGAMESEERAEVAYTRADLIAKQVLDRFKQLPRKGKPAANEWTVLAGFVAEYGCRAGHGRLAAVALGTGSKCMGHSRVRREGDALGDSHAEVIARRALLRYGLRTRRIQPFFESHTHRLLIDEIEQWKREKQADNESQEEIEEQRGREGRSRLIAGAASADRLLERTGAEAGDGGAEFRLRRNVRLHLYISQTPCTASKLT